MYNHYLNTHEYTAIDLQTTPEHREEAASSSILNPTGYIDNLFKTYLKPLFKIQADAGDILLILIILFLVLEGDNLEIVITLGLLLLLGLGSDKEDSTHPGE